MKLIDYTSSSRGAAAKLAADLKVSSVTVHEWSHEKKTIPADRCPAIEIATACAVTCEELLPNVNWVRMPDSEWPHPDGRPLLDHTKIKKAA